MKGIGVNMKTTKSILVFFLAFLLLVPNTFAGGGNRTGTGGAAQLLIPVGARGVALGMANIASASGVEALYWNPAGVAKMNNSVDVTFSHMNYLADIGVEYGAVSAAIADFGVLSLNLKSLSIGDIPVTTVRDPDGTGRTFTPQMLTAGISYSRMLTDQIGVGITTNIITESLGEVSTTGVGFNIGLLYNNLAQIKDLSFGIVMKNLGPNLQFDGSGLLVNADVTDFQRPPGFVQINSAPFELPTSFELGFAYKPMADETNSLLTLATFQHNNFSGDEYKLGLEYGFQNMFFVRGGYDLSPESQTADYIYGLTAGVGVNYQMEGLGVRFDYAYRDVKYFEANHIFQISLGF